MNDQISLPLMLDDMEHSSLLLSGRPGIQNDCGVYTDNVLEFREGELSGVYVKVRLCAEGNYILYTVSYQVGTYGCMHPLCRPCHECHRASSAEFLAECIYNVFQHSVIPDDKNLADYQKETQELLKLCKKVCDRIMKEVA